MIFEALVWNRFDDIVNLLFVDALVDFSVGSFAQHFEVSVGGGKLREVQNRQFEGELQKRHRQLLNLETMSVMQNCHIQLLLMDICVVKNSVIFQLVKERLHTRKRNTIKKRIIFD